MGNLFSNVFSNFSDFWGAFFGIGEIILMAIIIYYTIRTLFVNNAKSMIILYAISIFILGGVFLTTPEFQRGWFLFVPAGLSMVFILIFNLEVKRDIWTANQSGKGETKSVTTSISNDEINTYISNIIKAVQNFSKNNTGALIVLSNGNLTKQVLDSGVILNADISTQLIESIFFPKSALHDGAMIINGHRVEAAGCFVPITQKTNLSKDLGSRHRAGIGVTETADVVSIIVSEETGIISVAKHGIIENYADYDKLLKTLNDYYWKDLSVQTRRVKNV